MSFSVAPPGCAFSSAVTSANDASPGCIAARCNGNLPVDCTRGGLRRRVVVGRGMLRRGFVLSRGHRNIAQYTAGVERKMRIRGVSAGIWGPSAQDPSK